MRYCCHLSEGMYQKEEEEKKQHSFLDSVLPKRAQSALVSEREKVTKTQSRCVRV